MPTTSDPTVEDLKALPQPIGQPILAAWNVKEDLMDLLTLHGIDADRATIRRRLATFYESAAASGDRDPASQRLRARCATIRRARPSSSEPLPASSPSWAR